MNAYCLEGRGKIIEFTETFAISKDLEICTRIEAKSGGESRNATLGSILHKSMGEWPDLEMQSALDSEVGH